VDLNKCNFIGRLTKPPKYLEAGSEGQDRCTFTVAINRVVPDANGPTADYIPCVIWGPEAKHFCECRGVGDEVGVIGRIRTSMVHKAGGTPNFFWEVRVDEISYGRKSMKNLTPKTQDANTSAVSTLNSEFSHGE
jgi:single-strand DNA-binding protein